jgi:DnaK suppressor protein
MEKESNMTTTMKGAGQTAAVPNARREDLRRFLNDRRRELLATLRVRMDGVREGRSSHAMTGVLDQEEASEADVQEDIELALIEMKAETLSRIDEALARLDAGVYGRCDSCGQEISSARLRALPLAVRCLDCEALHETDRQRHGRAVDHARPRD